jgi:hypothetical protein
MILTASFVLCQTSDSVKCYNKEELKAITLKLIEGAECFEIKEIIEQQNIYLIEQKKSYINTVDLLTVENENLNKKYQKEVKRKKIWRTTTISLGGVLTSIILILQFTK